jgi:hypothetical protein
MLSQLTYISHRNANCTKEEMKRILSSCQDNNPLLDITGVLLYSDSKFIQMVEGNAKTILALYDKIKLDNRHRNVVMISYGLIKERAFPSWHMGARKIEGNKVDFKTEISREDETIFNNILNGKEESGTRVISLLKKFF